MQKIKNFVKAFFAVSYRLSVWQNGNVLHIEAKTKDELNAQLCSRRLNLHGLTWTLYQQGPCFMPEREIDSRNQ